MEMRCVGDYCGLVIDASGRKVHNTHGELHNSELPAKYGFTLHTGPFSLVQLDQGVLLHKIGETLGGKDIMKRERLTKKCRCVNERGKKNCVSSCSCP